MKRYKRQFIYTIIGALMVSAGTAGMAYLIKPIMDEIFIKFDREMLYILPLLVALTAFLKGGGRYIQAYFTVYIGQSIITQFRTDLLDTLLRMELGFFHGERKGTLISRILSDTGRIQHLVSNALPTMFREFLTAISLIGVTIYHSPKLALLAFVLIPLTIYPLSKLRKRMRKISRQNQEKHADMTARLTEIFNNVEIIQAHSNEHYEAERFSKDVQKTFELQLKATRTNEIISPIMETMGAIGIALVIIVGGNEVMAGEMSVGTFFSFMTALFMVYTPIRSLLMHYNRLQDAVVAVERIFEFLDLRPAITSGTRTALTDIKRVDFENISLNYGEKRALHHINLSVTSPQTIALVGDSGGGKSSMVNLLMRFFESSEGSLRINGEDIKDYDLNALRGAIAIVTQRVFIFNDTIAENVAYGKAIDEAKVIAALKEANAWDFVSEMEEGIHTPLGEFGVNLSGGQRQRIAIARAIYKEPKMLILDEATSALDNQSEALIQEAFERLSQGKITFVIAHRLSTIKHAQKIAVLKQGEIIGLGSDAELLESCEEYQRLKQLSLH